MPKVLVLYAHPRADRTEINGPMADTARSIDGVTVVDLYAEYPDFNIDVALEQRRLLEHDVIVLQHPLYWYSSPAIIKEWQDLVLQYGFAYGQEGVALKGKFVLNAVTAGAAPEAYTADGSNHSDIRRLLVPFETMASLCRMKYLAPFVLYRSGHAVDEERLQPHLASYEHLLKGLVAGALDVRRAEKLRELPHDLSGLLNLQEAN